MSFSDGWDGAFKLFLVLFFVFIPLGTWKLAEIVFAIFKHVRWVW